MNIGTVLVAAPIERERRSPINNLERAFASYRKTGGALFVRRDDHPHIDGPYYYAIAAADKHAWAPGERALTQDEIADLWYRLDCPPV